MSRKGTLPLPEPHYEREGVKIYCLDSKGLVPLVPASAVVVTDPPYGTATNTNYRRFTASARSKPGNEKWQANAHPPVQGDGQPFHPGQLLRFRAAVLWGAHRYAQELPPGAWLVWDKRPLSGRSLTAGGEVAWLSRGHGVHIFTHIWHGFARATENRPPLLGLHPTQKPVALMEHCLERMTKPGDLVLDPYMGSGPVPLACLRMGRRCIAAEIVPAYFEIARRRLAREPRP